MPTGSLGKSGTESTRRSGTVSSARAGAASSAKPAPTKQATTRACIGSSLDGQRVQRLVGGCCTAGREMRLWARARRLFQKENIKPGGDDDGGASQREEIGHVAEHRE